jgi:hypothetical protein
MNRTLLFLAAVAGVLAPSSAFAIDGESLPNPIYGVGGNAIKPLLKRYGTALSAAADPITIVYQGPGQCFGIYNLVDETPLTGTAIYFDASGTEQTCDLPLAGVQADFGGLNNRAELCAGVDAVPSGIADFRGPVQSVDFIVPKASSQTSISAEAAYFVYGFGATGEASPWTDETQIFKRNPASIALLVGLAIGVPVEKFVGIDANSNGNMITVVANATNPEAAIGLVAGEVAQANRATVTSLAYQHFDQSCGYWPDSTSTAFDKVNVRDGHYFLWANTRFYTHVDGAGVPTVPGVETFLGLVSRTLPSLDGIDPNALEIAAGTVPDCAMKVTRETDLGPLASYAPEEPCGCFFEATATGATSCDSCTVDADCTGGASKCRFGYCEEY